MSRAYKAPFAFTGGTIAKVNVDVSGKPYADWSESSRGLSRRTEAMDSSEGLMKRVAWVAVLVTALALAACARTESWGAGRR